MTLPLATAPLNLVEATVAAVTEAFLLNIASDVAH